MNRASSVLLVLPLVLRMSGDRQVRECVGISTLFDNIDQIVNIVNPRPRRSPLLGGDYEPNMVPDGSYPRRSRSLDKLGQGFHVDRGTKNEAIEYTLTTLIGPVDAGQGARR